MLLRKTLLQGMLNYCLEQAITSEIDILAFANEKGSRTEQIGELVLLKAQVDNSEGNEFELKVVYINRGGE